MNAIEKLFGVCVVIAVMFIFPISYARDKLLQIQFSSIDINTDSFIKNICAKGYIDERLLSYFFNSIYTVDEPVTIELSVNRIDNEELSNYQQTYISEEFYFNEITRIINAEGRFLLQLGDIVTISLTGPKETFITKKSVVSGCEWR